MQLGSTSDNQNNLYESCYANCPYKTNSKSPSGKFIDIILFDFQDAAKRSRNNRDRNLANLRTENRTVSAEKAAKRQEYLDLREIYENKIRLRDERIQQYNDKRQRILDHTRRAERKDAPG